MGNSKLKNKAILLSGGIDSAALAFWKRPRYGIYINYGQVCAQSERAASSAIAAALGMSYLEIQIDCSSLGTGDLTNHPPLPLAPVSEWWPYRNQLLITLGAMKAISFEVDELLFGAVSTDKKHSDGDIDFIKSISSTLKIQEGNMRVKAPAIKLSSEELIRCSRVPESILGWTHSCHKSNIPCGCCNGCSKHISIKQNLGII